MAERLRLVIWREPVKKLQRAGWTLVRRRGSHMMLTHPGYRWTLSVPDHREIGPGLLQKIVKQAGLTPPLRRSIPFRGGMATPLPVKKPSGARPSP